MASTNSHDDARDSKNVHPFKRVGPSAEEEAAGGDFASIAPLFAGTGLMMKQRWLSWVALAFPLMSLFGKRGASFSWVQWFTSVLMASVGIVVSIMQEMSPAAAVAAGSTGGADSGTADAAASAAATTQPTVTDDEF